jgi:putative transposase
MPTIKTELLDELLSGVKTPDDLLGDGGVFRQLKKALMERALGAELTPHLGYEKGVSPGRARGNSRNGQSIPRDRAGTFEPVLVPKGMTRLDGFDSKIISLYARGLSVREIQAHLKEMYGTEVSPDLISRVTDAVLDEVKEWQNRPLEALYPIVFFDALRVKVRDEGIVKSKAVYVALFFGHRGPKPCAGSLDRADRGRQILAQGDERVEDARPERHLDRGR